MSRWKGSRWSNCGRSSWYFWCSCCNLHYRYLNNFHVLSADSLTIIKMFLGEEYFTSEDSTDITTVFVLDSFEGSFFNDLNKAKKLVLGCPALKQLADRKETLPNNTRPLYNLAMLGVVVCFTGFRVKDDLVCYIQLKSFLTGNAIDTIKSIYKNTFGNSFYYCLLLSKHKLSIPQYYIKS